MPVRKEYISESLRLIVAERASYRCEYCLIHEADTYIGCEVDHIISVKHGGITHENNLAYACFPCNRYKGSDIATLNEKEELIRFYNPRIDQWNIHFKISANVILPLSDIGAGTIKIFKFNEIIRCEERAELQEIDRYPTF